MEELSNSEAWLDLGYSNERPSHEKALFRIPESPIPNFKHEPKETTVQRSAKALEAIFSVFPDASFDQKDSMNITIQTPNNRFEFYPASDCYFIASSQSYGMGISALCHRLKSKNRI